MLNPTRMTQLALTVVAFGALVGCGKAAPVQQPHPALVNDSLTRAPGQNAHQTVAGQTQQAREAEANRADNQRTRQPGPGHDHED
jgi:hypothetical protein